MTENGPFAVSVKIGIKDNKKRMLLSKKNLYSDTVFHIVSLFLYSEW